MGYSIFKTFTNVGGDGEKNGDGEKDANRETEKKEVDIFWRLLFEMRALSLWRAFSCSTQIIKDEVETTRHCCPVKTSDEFRVRVHFQSVDYPGLALKLG